MKVVRKIIAFLGFVQSAVIAIMFLSGRGKRAGDMSEHVIRLVFAVLNWRRRRFRDFDYVMITLPERIPALPDPINFIQQRILRRPSFSLLDLSDTFERIGDDPRPKGVILYVRNLAMSLADLQTLRDMILRLRERGKRVVCFAHNYSTATYFVASAADDIVLQAGGELLTFGLRRDVIFLRDALDAIGLQMDSVAIAPYKDAADMFTRSDISPEGRDMLNWLLDSNYDTVIQGIAGGRDITPDAARAMVDGAPYLDQATLDAGFVDAVVTEEGLAEYLDAEHLVHWDKALSLLPIKWRGKPEKVVAVLRLSGNIVEGESRRPPGEIPFPVFGGERMGSITVVQQARTLMKDERVAAVVLFIDSGGGSATASEAMSSALDELAQVRPLVVYMNGVAGSGGYYIATPAQWIVAQPGTITGSIGVVTGKFINSETLKKLRLNALEFMRGANASYISGIAPWTDAQREQAKTSIERVYDQFVGRVAASRDMTPEAVDAVGGGRVWTGAQALENGLVDQLGGLKEAVAKARELAELPDDTPAVIFRGKGRPLAPQLAEAVNPAASLFYVRENLEMAFNGRTQLLMPFTWE